MRSTIFLFLLVAIISPNLSYAQKGGPIVFSVDGDTIWGAEFERVFNKNNRTPNVRPSTQEILDYRNLYVRYKLKVREANRLGMDTNQAYIKELAGYRKQLAQPYLTDKTVTDKLVNEAYERSKWEVDASNLMIHLSPTASPADTLAAWNRISRWQKLIESGQIPFDKLTTDSSTDEHGRNHAGRLGYFTAFSMIYPFENQAYTIPVGGVSKVFRTQFGYHVLKVNDKRPARPDIKVAHILIRINNDADYVANKPRIDAIYERLNKGEKWEDLVLNFSEDFNTRERNGELNWIKSIGGQIPEEFREAAYLLKNGSYSAPVKTSLGWHIIKRLEEKSAPTFDESKEGIKLKISRDSRSELNREAVLARIKQENNFKVFEKNWSEYLNLIDTNVLKGSAWVAPKSMTTDAPLFSIDSKLYTNTAFTNYLKQTTAGSQKVSPKFFAEKMFEEYSDDMNLQYEEEILEVKYDDFKYLMQEYRDGILLFELTNEKVWSKATSDTLGLKAFYEANVNKYHWKERANAKVYTCSSLKTAKKLTKLISKGMPDEEMLKALNKKDALAVKLNERIYEHGQDSTIDKLNWKTTDVQNAMDGNNHLRIKIVNTIAPGPKLLKEAMGPVTSDFQTSLEDLWIAELKERYKVVLNPEAIDLLFTKKP